MPTLEQVNLEDLTNLFQAVHQHEITEGVRDRTHELHINDELWGSISSAHRTIPSDSDEAILTVTTGLEPVWGMEPRNGAYDIVRSTPKYLTHGVLLPLVRRREYMPLNRRFTVPALGHIVYLSYGTIGQTLQSGGELAVLPAHEVPTLRGTALLGAIRAARSAHESAQPQ